MGKKHENARAAQVLAQLKEAWPKIRRFQLAQGFVFGLLAGAVDLALAWIAGKVW